MTPEQRKLYAINAISKATALRLENNLSLYLPIDTINLAEQLGCSVWFQSLPSLEGMYSTVPRPTIIVGSQRTAGRKNFTCAHELGHHVFSHGIFFEKLIESSCSSQETPQEYIADVFASHLLMPKTALLSTIMKRGWTLNTITPDQVFILASYFGVGYSTIINHLVWSLSLLPENYADILLKTQPKDLKAHYEASPDKEVVIVDSLWQSRAADLQINDILVLPENVVVEDTNKVKFIKNTDSLKLWEATSPGYAHAYDPCSDWAVHIRISRKWFEGRAKFRFYDEIEE